MLSWIYGNCIALKVWESYALFYSISKKQHSKLLSLPVSYCRHQDSLPCSCDLSSPTTSGLLESVTLLIGYFYWHQQTIVEGKLIPSASVLHSPTRLPVCLRLRHPNHSMHLRHCALHAGALCLLLINGFLNPCWEAEFLSILYQDSIVQYFKLLHLPHPYCSALNSILTPSTFQLCTYPETYFWGRHILFKAGKVI